MGYGGTGYATVSVDIVETDVQAIVQGLTGLSSRTLTDLDYDLNNLLYYNGNTAGAFLQFMLDQLNNLNYNTSGSSGYLYNIENYLGGYSYGALYDGAYAVQYLNWISNYSSSIQQYLYDSGTNNSVAQVLSYIWSLLQSIEAKTSQLTFDGSSKLRVTTT